MEENRKKTNFQNEFSSNFFKTYSKELNLLENSINKSYERLWNKFLTLVENNNFCKVIQIQEQKRLVSKTKNDHDKKVKVNEKFEKLIESFVHVKIDNNEKNKSSKPVFRSEQKTQTYSKFNDLTAVTKAKKNLNFENKSTKNDDIQFKMHPPLASSSIIIPRESQKNYNSPKADSKNQLSDFSSTSIFIYFFQTNNLFK